MNLGNHDAIEKLTETERRYEVTRNKSKETHLFDENARLEEALCGAETSHNVKSVECYVEDRVHGSSDRNVCKECKALAAPLAEQVIEIKVEEQEAKGRFDVADDYCELAENLAREIGQSPPGG